MKIDEKKIAFARSLRQNQSDAEKTLWYALRGRRLQGLKFKRQHVIEPYIVDFYCADEKLIVEIDGGQHNDDKGRQRDTLRTKYLEKLGYKVIRFWNNEVLVNTDLVLEEIAKHTSP